MKASRGREGTAASNFPTLRSPTPMTALSSSTTTKSLSATMGWVAREEQTARPASQNARKHKSGVKTRISAFLSFRTPTPPYGYTIHICELFHVTLLNTKKIKISDTPYSVCCNYFLFLPVTYTLSQWACYCSSGRRKIWESKRSGSLIFFNTLSSQMIPQQTMHYVLSMETTNFEISRKIKNTLQSFLFFYFLDGANIANLCNKFFSWI